VPLCGVTCANASAIGTAYDCSAEANGLATRPATIACAGSWCSAAECCTVATVPAAAAREQFEQAIANAPPISSWRAVSSSIVFAAEISDLVEGSAARGEFELGFKASMASALGDGATVRAEHVFIDGIRAGSVVVDWHVLVPPTVVTTVVSLVQSLKDSGETIDVSTASGLSVAGDTSSMDDPTAEEEEAASEDPVPSALEPDGGGLDLRLEMLAPVALVVALIACCACRCKGRRKPPAADPSPTSAASAAQPSAPPASELAGLMAKGVAAVERGGSFCGGGGAVAANAVADAAQAQHARLAQLRADATAASGPTAPVDGLQLWVKTTTGTLPATADRGLDTTVAELRLKVRSCTCCWAFV
jgi:hypothetical protein